jgi:rhodanese-related sulfurtransferase
MTDQIKRVTVEETMAALSRDNNAVMIDVCELDEIRAMAPAVGKACPMSTINPLTFHTVNKVTKDQPIFLFCRSGNRSMRVATALSDMGYTNLANVEGGIIAWEAAGLPVKKSES